MEIVGEIVEYNQTGMTVAKCLMILVGVVLLVPISIGIIGIIKQKKTQIKGEKFKKISVMILMYIIATTLIASSIYVLFKVHARYTSVKVEGQAILEKYEDEGNGTVVAKLKDKNNQVIHMYLNSSDVLNQKEKINRGDKVRVQSDKAYPIIKRDTIFPSTEGNSDYELKEGSELVKVK